MRMKMNRAIKVLKKLAAKPADTEQSKDRFSERELAYMHSLKAAVLKQEPKRIRPVLMFWVLSVTLFIIWAAVAEIDEIARGVGKIVPSGENKLLQNLEGGIIQELLVDEGDIVRKGQVLVKLSNQKSAAMLAGNNIKAMELEAKLLRLRAEANQTNFITPLTPNASFIPLINREKSLYLTNQAQLQTQQQALQQKLSQRENELTDAKMHVRYLKISLRLINEEVTMTEPVVNRGVKPRVEFLKLQREANSIEENYQSAKISIASLNSAISEANSNLQALVHKMQSQAKKDMNEVSAELDRINANNKALTDQSLRTLVRAPSNGIIQNIFVHTLGGVLKPGDNLIELVPSDDVLWVEAKLKPSDIAFVYPGQKAMVKFTAYDFSIYGGLAGEVVKISADTQTDRQENTFYTVHIKTKQSFLGTSQQPLKIIPGMTTNVDIITGKKSVLNYLLKPILRSTYYTFSER
jgi:adhesin transport system membrane fusion protein